MVSGEYEKRTTPDEVVRARPRNLGSPHHFSRWYDFWCTPGIRHHSANPMGINVLASVLSQHSGCQNGTITPSYLGPILMPD